METGTQRYDKLTVTEYMKVNKIKSRNTVYKQIQEGYVEAVDLNNGKSKQPNWRILVPRNSLAVH